MGVVVGVVVRLLLLLLLVGCSDIDNLLNTDIEDKLEIDCYMDLPMDESGYYYLYDYPNNLPNSYTNVNVKTSIGIHRVYWFSVDSFSVIHQNQIFNSPIVNYSVYTNDEGYSKQHIYTNNLMLGDTLMVVGYLDNETYDVVEFIVY